MQSSLLPARRRVAPVVTLLILAPVLAEILFGSTHITALFVLIPEIGAYGCGALIIRALVRYQHKGWTTILLLGIAFAIAEECVILQTSLYPFAAADLQHIYGRAFGVNWIYLLWAVGYESVWAIVLPIQLTELIFPERRDDPWLGTRGLIIAGIFFLLASVVAWYTWTHFVPRLYPGLHYHPSLLTIIIALVVIAALVAVALGSRSPSSPVQSNTRTAPQSWLVGLVAFVSGLLWFAPLILHYGLFPTFPVAIAVVLILAWAAGTFFLIRYWSTGQNWGDAQRMTLIFGALMASMLAGFKLSGIVLPIDFIGKVVFNVIAIFGLLYLTWKIQHRKAAEVSLDTQH
ncbi:MAG TPA: hypothetical protein VH593_33290 [Ktedonobacteraceae bacterium]